MKVLTYDEWSPVEPNGTPRRISEPTSNWLHFGAVGKPWHLDTAIGHARYHINTKGWLTVGYSALVVLYPEPALLLGRVLRRGAHTQNYNSTGAGICVPGNVTHVPDEGLDALAEALRIGAREGWWPDEFTGGHRDVANKPCPGEPLYIRIPEINRRARSKTEPEEDELPEITEENQKLLNAMANDMRKDGVHANSISFVTRAFRAARRQLHEHRGDFDQADPEQVGVAWADRANAGDRVRAVAQDEGFGLAEFVGKAADLIRRSE